MDKEKNKELVANLKSRRRRKYILLALAAFVIVSAVVGMNIEKRDAKLPDGQGTLIAEENDGNDKADINQDKDKKAEKKDKKKSESNKGSKDSKDSKDEQKSETEKSDVKNEKSDKKPAGSTKPKKDISNMSDSEKDKIKPSDIAVDNSDDYSASNGGNGALKPKKPKPVTVTLEIRCDTLSSDMSKLENPAIKDYIPEDGTILATSTYKGTTENTVFDALNTLCRNNDIQLEFSYTPVFESYYIEGINYLYEFDGGKLSGWMYKVNDWFPNYGCSSYYLKDGDVIQWVYTCDLGKDVGDNSMGAS